MVVTMHQLSAPDVLLDFEANSKKAILQSLAAEASRRLGRAEQEILDALKAREKVGSTGLGRGVALPHARMDGIAPTMLFARLRRPVDYEAPDEEPVDLVILVLWPSEAPEGLLPTLAETCRAIREPEVLQRLRAAKTPEEVVALVNRPSPEGAAGQPGV